MLDDSMTRITMSNLGQEVGTRMQPYYCGASGSLIATLVGQWVANSSRLGECLSTSKLREGPLLKVLALQWHEAKQFVMPLFILGGLSGSEIYAAKQRLSQQLKAELINEWTRYCANANGMVVDNRWGLLEAEVMIQYEIRDIIGWCSDIVNRQELTAIWQRVKLEK